MYRAGRQADALGVPRHTQSRLADELGIDARPALQRLERQILNQVPALDWQPAPAVATVSRRISAAPGARAGGRVLDGKARPPVDGADPAGATLRRFEAIVHYLTGLSEAEPLVIPLDQLHRADPSSLRLLAHLAGSVPASRILLAVSYWPGEAATLAQKGVHRRRLRLSGGILRRPRGLLRPAEGRDESHQDGDEPVHVLAEPSLADRQRLQEGQLFDVRWQLTGTRKRGGLQGVLQQDGQRAIPSNCW